MQRGFAQELRRIGFSALAALVFGLFIGQVFAVLFITLLAYVGWNLWQMHLVTRWLNKNTTANAPECTGIWEEIVHLVMTQRKRHRKEKGRLQNLLLRVQETTAALPDAVVLLDDGAHIQWWNRTARQVLGLQSGDNGKIIFNYVRSPRFKRYLEAAEFSEPLIIASASDGDIFLSYQVSRYGQGQYLLVIRDVSRLHKLEIMRKDFIGNVSHELRTPLTVVRGYIETMVDHADTLPAIWSKALNQMDAQARRMTLTIEDLLTLTRLETEDNDYKQTEVDIAQLLESIKIDAVALSDEKRHRIEVEIPRPFKLLGVQDELRSCLSNLAFNAVRYSPEQSVIILRASYDDEKVTLEVQDHGIGIEARHIPRLTERFYRVDASRSLDTGGTGLGLAIVKHVLSRHQGQLEITSQINHGSTFSCVFQLSRLVEIKATA